jgi:hypothetical protein
MKVTDLCATAAEGKSCFSEGVSYWYLASGRQRFGDPQRRSSCVIRSRSRVRSRPTHLQAACSPLRLLSGRQPPLQVAPARWAFHGTLGHPLGPVSSRLRAILWTWTLALAQLCFFFWRLWLDWRRTQVEVALRCGLFAAVPAPTGLLPSLWRTSLAQGARSCFRRGAPAC